MVLFPNLWASYKALLPYQTFRTQTRDLALAVGSNRLWKKFCPIMGLNEMTDDPRLATNAARTQNRETLIEELQKVFLTKSYEDWETLLVKHCIPVGAINRINDVIDHPQLKAREAFVTTDHPVAGPVSFVGVPVKLAETPGSIRSPVPCLDNIPMMCCKLF